MPSGAEDADVAPPPLDGSPAAAAPAGTVEASREFAEREQLEERLGVRERRKNLSSSADVVRKLRVGENGDLVDEDEEEDIVLEFDYQGRSRSRCFACCMSISLLVTVLLGGAGLMQAYRPWPLECEVATVVARRFKVDVSDFWTPKIQSTVQVGFDVRNRNPLRQLILEEAKLEVFEAETGLKLGTAQQGRLFLNPFSTLRMTLAIKDFGSSLPQPEQRRIADLFLRHKALMLTIVLTSLSKVCSPCKATDARSICDSCAQPGPTYLPRIGHAPFL